MSLGDARGKYGSTPFVIEMKLVAREQNANVEWIRGPWERPCLKRARQQKVTASLCFRGRLRWEVKMRDRLNGKAGRAEDGQKDHARLKGSATEWVASEWDLACRRRKQHSTRPIMQYFLASTKISTHSSTVWYRSRRVCAGVANRPPAPSPTNGYSATVRRRENDRGAVVVRARQAVTVRPFKRTVPHLRVATSLPLEHPSLPSPSCSVPPMPPPSPFDPAPTPVRLCKWLC